MSKDANIAPDIEPVADPEFGMGLLEAFNKHDQAIREQADKLKDVHGFGDLPTDEKPKDQDTEEPPKSDVSFEDDIGDDDLNSIFNPKKTDPEPDNDDDFDTKYVDEPDDLKDDAKALAKWKELKQEAKIAKQSRRQLERSVAEWKTKYEEAVKAAPTGSDEYKDKYEALLKKHAVLALEEDPKFTQEVLNPYNQAQAALQEIAHQFSIPLDKIDEALSKESRAERNKALAALLQDSEMDEINRSEFAEVVKDTIVLGAKVREGYEKAHELYRASREQENFNAESQRKQQVAERQAAKGDVIASLKKAEVLGEYVDKVDQSKLDEFLSGDVSPKLTAYHGIAGLLLPELRKEIKSLREALKSKVSATPAINSTANASPPKSKPKDDDLDRSPGDYVGSAFDAWKAGRRA